MQSATRKIVGTALFAALSFVVSLLEFPIFPAAGFLKLDFSAVFTLLGGFMYGPVAALVICAVKELIRFAMGSGTGGVGEIANFVVTAAFIIIPTTVYRFKKGLPVVIITLIAGIFLQVCAAVIANRFIMFPLYMGDGAASAFSSLWYYIIFFNLIKGFSVSVIVMILYKRVSWLFKKINLRNPAENDTINNNMENDNAKVSAENAANAEKVPK
ncbi:MAG: ECF transporter S component [Clostridia bacterium]|nr:ECF transporter S component [Clostridia bacterium]